MKKVIVVEPDPAVRETIHMFVEHASHERWELVSIPRFEDAVGVVGDHPDASIVLCGYGGLEAKGAQAAMKVKKTFPTQHVVVMSSYAGREEVATLEVDGFFDKLGDQLAQMKEILARIPLPA